MLAVTIAPVLNSVSMISEGQSIDAFDSEENIDLELKARSIASITPATTSIPDTQVTSPTPLLLAMHKKRKRAREEDGTAQKHRSLDDGTTGYKMQVEGMKELAKARLMAAELAFKSTRGDVPDALDVLSKEYTQHPRKLSSEHMQLAIQCLMQPNMATVFLSLSKHTVMEEHRDNWLERNAGVDINDKNKSNVDGSFDKEG
jgi:hypothetical protein